VAGAGLAQERERCVLELEMALAPQPSGVVGSARPMLGIEALVQAAGIV
jgi:hypothetical protein